MKNTILPGDKVLVGKLGYRAIIPHITFKTPELYRDFHFRKEILRSYYSLYLRSFRKKGSSIIMRNDVLIFRFPDRKEPYYIKRCIGLPGEILMISEGEVKCNGRTQKIPEQGFTKFCIWTNSIDRFYILVDSIKLNGNLPTVNRELGCFEMELTHKQLRLFKADSCVDSISYVPLITKRIDHNILNKNIFQWNSENISPILIPKRGMRIELSYENYFLYKKVFERYERKNFVFKNNQVIDNGKTIHQYTFKQDYFFMVGDNRHNSIDSRSWGFVPEEAIVGKAVLVLFSNDYSGFKWDRFFRIIK